MMLAVSGTRNGRRGGCVEAGVGWGCDGVGGEGEQAEGRLCVLAQQPGEGGDGPGVAAGMRTWEQLLCTASWTHQSRLLLFSHSVLELDAGLMMRQFRRSGSQSRL